MYYIIVVLIFIFFLIHRYKASPEVKTFFLNNWVLWLQNVAKKHPAVSPNLEILIQRDALLPLNHSCACFNPQKCQELMESQQNCALRTRRSNRPADFKATPTSRLITFFILRRVCGCGVYISPSLSLQISDPDRSLELKLKQREYCF